MINGSEFPTSISLFEFGPDAYPIKRVPNKLPPLYLHCYLTVSIYRLEYWYKKPSVPGNPRFYNWISLYSSFTFPQNVVVEKEILILTQTLPLIFDLEIDF